MGCADATDGWTAIIPVKPLSLAKSRLRVPGVDVADLALAFLNDVLTATTGTARIAETLVVSADPSVAQAASARGATPVDDTGHDGINAAARWAASRRTGSGGLLVVVADLACLTATSLGRVLAAAEEHRASFVADAEGTGTSMWLARDPTAQGPHFGPDSRAEHRASGAFDLVAAAAGGVGPWLPARLDVDTPADLDRARILGLGAAAALLLGTQSPPVPVTVLRVDGAAVVLVGEDGKVSREPLESFRAAGWRRVTPGQRVLVVDGRVWPGT